jgi:hypothetical protein
MDLRKDFRFRSVSGTVPQPPASNLLGPLGMLKGTWKGRGFNQIWRPFHATPPVPAAQDRFLELNETLEILEFVEIPGDVPNRGLVQPDINVHAIRYLQQVQDAHVVGADGNLAGIHVEPGFWIHVPSTTDPAEPTSTVARLANIPHGVSLVAQGVAFAPISTLPPIANNPVSIKPFPIGNPAAPINFPEQTLTNPSAFRTSADDIPNVTQAMVDNPAEALVLGLQGKNVISTVTLTISTNPTTPLTPLPAGITLPGSGLSNIAFLQGTANGPNARAAQMDAIFWIETIQDPGGKIYFQLQYQQIVLLNFNGLSWPHISVATLIKQDA